MEIDWRLRHETVLLKYDWSRLLSGRGRSIVARRRCHLWLFIMLVYKLGLVATLCLFLFIFLTIFNISILAVRRLGTDGTRSSVGDGILLFYHIALCLIPVFARGGGKLARASALRHADIIIVRIAAVVAFGIRNRLFYCWFQWLVEDLVDFVGRRLGVQSHGRLGQFPAAHLGTSGRGKVCLD